MKQKRFFKIGAAGALLTVGLLIAAFTTRTASESIRMMDRPDTEPTNVNYVSYRTLLRPSNFVKLSVGSIQPGGWVKKYLELQHDGLTGHLGEISAWLEKDNNTWLTIGGGYGWEEVPYWLKGYGNLAYTSNDPKMIAETETWIEGVFTNCQPNGYFGLVNERNGKCELWAQMIMLWCLQSYYEYSQDQRATDLMTNYFKWQITVPNNKFPEDYWGNSRGGNNIISTYWLYSHAGDAFLLSLAKKIYCNTVDRTKSTSLSNWYNVNTAQCFHEPATYYMQTGDSAMPKASYNVHHLIRRTFGQVPGGMFGADENTCLGYIDPRQGVETCGPVEQMASDETTPCMTGDSIWVEHCEEVVFNSRPVVVMPDFKALRCITCPNHTVSDSKNYHPGINNRGPFLSMNPFSSRCCQYNHAQGWPYFSEHLILAVSDNGIAAAIYVTCKAIVRVSNGKEIVLHEEISYPFEEGIKFTVSIDEKVDFPFYLRIPPWAKGAEVRVNGRKISVKPVSGKYLCIEREWADGDKVETALPMSLSMRTWQVNKNSVSTDYGPLTLSLKIDEKYIGKDSRETAIGDSKWQKGADPKKWPTTEIYANSPRNYSLVLDKKESLKNPKVVRKSWPANSFSFTVANVPSGTKATSRIIPERQIDEIGFCGVLPEEDAVKGAKEETILIPMGTARLRISAFPNTKE